MTIEIEAQIPNGAPDNVVRTVTENGRNLNFKIRDLGKSKSMPNGGVPIHMVPYPKDGSPFVFYCNAGQLFLYDRESWVRDGVKGKPLCTLTKDEGSATAWFLKYWLGDEALRPAYSMRDRVKADFEL